mmetsp:Transcript_11885/g.25114  ORF Transcript_11885/g.25114 Transcript_11885/m.25114 type:complete len:793 (+) Transcript_11885:143-2521(+)|eukprot:CAMPEP_0201244338 /NCGR_PEP_ID=MMETSP0852-20130820/44515_1 /ASSEMBLY_ACC=CAM_ASM_000632 /TAXON_ID=183588 /ORGANISM="Pseudo-nitzschia fraudulenta, Strain WWA7" /LENGTH=792 /DNA_ID=CAMNT_0047541751 /DNA_START=109 /DNA_END=2487 /DNA_ORIENTATION=-
MSVPNPHYNLHLIKYYVLATLSFLVATGFHTSVYYHFAAMEEGLVEAAGIRFFEELDQLKAMVYYQESIQLHRKGIRDTLEAYAYANETLVLREDKFEKEEDLQRLRDAAAEKEHTASEDTSESASFAADALRLGRESVGSTSTGMALARLAEEENERSAAMLNEVASLEAEGQKKLKEAQNKLARAHATQRRHNNNNGDGENTGICRWAFVMFVCKPLLDDDAGGGSSSNQAATITTGPATPSNAVVRANRDVQTALDMIHHTEEQRAQAVELHQNASIHLNQSATILRDAQTFQDEVKADGLHAEEYTQKAKEEEAEAKKEEQQAEQEKAEIAHIETEIRNDTQAAESFSQKVVGDRTRENQAVQKMNQDLEFARQRQAQWEQTTIDATRHVATAGWEALVASAAAVCLFLLVAARIAATFRYQRPLQWILRTDPPHFYHDLLYLVCHLSIFLLAMGYVGELLRVFQNHFNTARAVITVVFAVDAAFLQVLFLHFVPSMLVLYRASRVESKVALHLVEELVLQRGSILALVSAIELLLCWCVMGTAVFSRIHKLNTHAAWLSVFGLSAGYWGFVLEKDKHGAGYWPPKHSGDAPRVSSDITSDGQLGEDNERHSLLKTTSFQGSSVQGSNDPGSVESSFVVPANDSCSLPSSFQPSVQPAEFCSSMESVPMGSAPESVVSSDEYGSLATGDAVFRDQLLRFVSLGKFSWRAELAKVGLLFEILIAALAIWIVFCDFTLVRRLSPLASGRVWDQAPLWIANMILFLAFSAIALAFINMRFKGRESGFETHY